MPISCSEHSLIHDASGDLFRKALALGRGMAATRASRRKPCLIARLLVEKSTVVGPREDLLLHQPRCTVHCHRRRLSRLNSRPSTTNIEPMPLHPHHPRGYCCFTGPLTVEVPTSQPCLCHVMYDASPPPRDGSVRGYSLRHAAC